MISHSLAGGMLEKVADMLEPVDMGIVGAGSGLPHRSMQEMVNE